MPAKTIRNYITNTANENQQAGYFNFRTNRQVVSRANTSAARRRSGTLTSMMAGAQKTSTGAPGNTLAGTQTQRGMNTYKQNNQLARSAQNNVRAGADLYLQAGPKLLNENSLFAGTSYGQSPLNSLVSTINISINQGIMQYQEINSSRSNRTNLLPGGSDTFIRTGQSSTNFGALSVRNGNTGTGSTQTGLTSAFINNALSQYQVGNKSPQRSNFLSSSADLYLRTGMKRLQEATLFQNL